ncbi:MAG: Homoserine/homoserine lactone efflux protein [Marinobacterium sp. xm-d-530]|jgi:homoserine/homoserine lactone efflux protein|nr:MAG: Homoserine/homoserine lactone efflux protein [Marinobacterium sp. xm-d-530]
MALELWLALLGAAIMISLSPGAGFATAVSFGLSNGVRGAAPAVFGLICGYGTQMLIVSLGLGALIATSPIVFNVIKYLGAAYLIWLGVQVIRSHAELELHNVEPLRIRERFIRAFLVNISNPKGMVFLLALVPQFLNPTEPQAPQLWMIGLTLVLVDWIVMTGYSGIAARLRTFVQNPKGRAWLNRASGSALILAGLVLSTATL